MPIPIILAPAAPKEGPLHAYIRASFGPDDVDRRNKQRRYMEEDANALGLTVKTWRSYVEAGNYGAYRSGLEHVFKWAGKYKEGVYIRDQPRLVKPFDFDRATNQNRLASDQEVWTILDMAASYGVPHIVTCIPTNTLPNEIRKLLIVRAMQWAAQDGKQIGKRSLFETDPELVGKVLKCRQCEPQWSDARIAANLGIKKRQVQTVLGTVALLIGDDPIRWRDLGTKLAWQPYELFCEIQQGRTDKVVLKRTQPESKEPVVRTCDQCGEHYTPTRKDQQFHNDACRVKAWRFTRDFKLDL